MTAACSAPSSGRPKVGTNRRFAIADWLLVLEGRIVLGVWNAGNALRPILLTGHPDAIPIAVLPLGKFLVDWQPYEGVRKVMMNEFERGSAD